MKYAETKSAVNLLWDSLHAGAYESDAIRDAMFAALDGLETLEALQRATGKADAIREVAQC